MSASDNKGWPQGQVDTATGGAVRFPTREEAMQDARRLNWQPIETLPTDRTVIITRPTLIQRPRSWLIQRLLVREPPYIWGTRATHWCEDTLGMPLLAPPPGNG